MTTRPHILEGGYSRGGCCGGGWGRTRSCRLSQILQVHSAAVFLCSPVLIGTNVPTLVLKTTPLARDSSRSSGRPCPDLDTSVKVSTIQPLKAQNGPGVAAPVISPGLLAALIEKVKATRPNLFKDACRNKTPCEVVGTTSAWSSLTHYALF